MSYFLPGYLWRGRKYISPKNACLRHSRHALLCLQFIRENENSTHFCSKLLAKNGFYFSVLFDFCWLFTRVWTGCIVFSFPPFALDSCFLLFPCAEQVSLFPALFTENLWCFPALQNCHFIFMFFAAYTCLTFSSCILFFRLPVLFTYCIMPVPSFMAIFGYDWFACSMCNGTILCFFFRLG